MKCLWLIFVLPTVLAQVGFGRSYLKNSRLCHQWHCLNSKLGLPDDLPPKDQFTDILTGLLPEGGWQETAKKVLDVCYGSRARVYTNTCPGQALFHCVVDQMAENCVEGSWRKNDACSDVFSMAGLKYMFSQSVYEDLEKNLPKELRPAWFMHNYFDTKCCNLPELFNATVLGQCGFSGFVNYYTHAPKYNTPKIADKVQNHLQLYVVPPGNGDKVRTVDLVQFQKTDDSTDPLDCCDMSEFVQPSWRSECGFQLSWEGQSRLVIKNDTAIFSTETPTPTSTQGIEEIKDLVLLPESCEKESCVFKKLNIVSDGGVVDRDVYLKMLDNFTDAHPTWTNAKARVVTKCLSKRRLSEYEADCEINRILACTFDVLTENCPYARKSDSCKHHKYKTGCQISSSKYRPKNRREICLLPELLNRRYLSGCGLESLRRAEHVTVEAPKPRKYAWSSSKYTCKDLTPSTTCLMSKMGIMNRYKFMDYFQMKDRIRRFTHNHSEWAALNEVYLSAFNNVPMYREHCSSAKRFLNVLDSMLMTCPISERNTTPHCTQMFADITNISPVNRNTSRHKSEEILKHFRHVFMPETRVTTPFSRVIRYRRPVTKKNPLYNYGILNSGAAPQVKVVALKSSTADPRNGTHVVLLPVSLRPPNHVRGPYNDGVLRDNPFSLHSQIAIAHNSTKTPSATNPAGPLTKSSAGSIHRISTVSFINNGRNSSIEIMKP